MASPANDRASIAAQAPVSPGWIPATVTPPDDRELLTWVNGPHIGRWDPVRRCWMARNEAVRLEPVRFWADVIAPGMPIR